ncbi:hypothetical protein Ddye_003148 [Dipteronia dyeriana]|uniref:Protein FAR1-RELATED SEQUENCE n=1 Tax=Dipteronia dyeriana TaxID=168575 RepID=A0AAD9XRQ6_9ROSI|nr:hypothetical protein Ddye_003148 [Dipteronia dyeriana]
MRRGMMREGCNAKLAVVKSKTREYVVKQFVEGHTHTLTSPQKEHLLRSCRKLNVVVYADHYNDLCVCDSYSKEEFELKWMEAIGKSNLGDDAWLRTMYEMRSKWMHAFHNHVFSTGMANSQRTESCHAFF